MKRHPVQHSNPGQSRLTRQSAFGRLDLLMLLLTSGIGIALVVPAILSAQATQTRMKCTENLRRIGVGAQSFARANEGRLPRDHVRKPRGSWNTEILAFIGEEQLARRYDLGQDWWEGKEQGNRAVVRQRVTTFLCPGAPHSQRWVLTRDPDQEGSSFQAAPTDYVGSAGAYYENNQPESLHPGAMHHRKIPQRVRLADILDGSSNTLLVVEMADKPNQWRDGKLSEDRSEKPQNPALSGQWGAPNWNHLRSYSHDGRAAFGPCAVNCSNGASIYGFHPGGANVLFVDGTVRFLPARMSQEMLIALVSIAGGELISPDDL